MKTKIIYISGSEIFNITDIRAAFEEVRKALQLDSETVLFGVPVDKDDAEVGAHTSECIKTLPETPDNIQPELDEQKSDSVEQVEIVDEPVEIVETVETVIEEVPEKPKKRARSRKTAEKKTEQEITEQPENNNNDEKIVPILSVLSVKDEEQPKQSKETADTDNVEETPSEDENDAIEISTEESNDVITEIDTVPETENEGEPDLEKLLSAMTPLQEDALETEEITTNPTIPDSEPDSETVDATLEQLATEFAEAQDKIATENKSSGRSKIGKLRNILPFKQSKHKDQGLGDLFGWAGTAANDEDFSIPGFFTNVNSKK